MQVYFERVRALFFVFLKRFARSSLVIMRKNESFMDGVPSADSVLTVSRRYTVQDIGQCAVRGRLGVRRRYAIQDIGRCAVHGRCGIPSKISEGVPSTDIVSRSRTVCRPRYRTVSRPWTVCRPRYRTVCRPRTRK